MLKSAPVITPFHKVMKLRMWFSALILVVGLKSALIPLINKAWDIQKFTTQFGISIPNFDLLKGVYSVLGYMLIVAGTLSVLWNINILRHKEKYKSAEIASGDERRHFIRSTTATISTLIVLLFLSIAVIISSMYSFLVSLTLLCLLLTYLAILFITYLIVNAKY